ncbi:hypothetical protein [Thalassovita sp.]|uniref:hypothetical protein n=1 Tax=Thalassovita sp. TaxID=1979401 RepID=UPI0028810CBB|nr:hypothetical protein [Thalassovita sp.]MDF1803366.1 hypothetical protein [Thalassovita sp.]
MQPAISIDYHQPAFELLHHKFRDKLRVALHESPRNVRQKYMLENLPVGLPLNADQGWEVGRKLLDVLEKAVAARLSQRDPIYWLHIYRRIGVMLSGDHENKTDPLTTALVRRMVELAIFRYGNEDAKNELWPSKSVSRRLVLGGWFEKAIKHFHKGDRRELRTLFQTWTDQLKGSSSLVIKDFGISDLETIYFVEGICYQYWRVSALLRSLGKGATIILDQNGDWTYQDDKDLDELINHYDSRIEFEDTNSLLAGVWLKDMRSTGESLADLTSFQDTIVVPNYNVRRAKLEQVIPFPSFNLAPGSLTNFLPAELNLKAFRDATEFLDEGFERKHGFSLSDLASILSALSSTMSLPEWILLVEDEDERHRLLSNNFLQSLKRGYSISPSYEDFVERIERRLDLIGFSGLCGDKIQKTLDFITLNPKKKSMISLWSGGPRPLIIQTPKVILFDPVGMYDFLRTLFVGIRDSRNLRGFSFEDQVRTDLEEVGYDVICGEKKNNAGEKREIDAAVLQGDTLFLFECFSAERPLDFELSKPSVLYDTQKTKEGKTKIVPGRNSRLAEKLDQVETLKNFFSSHPVGRNYDFSTVRRIEHFVVSPFVEWIWGKEERLWFEPSIPRIINPSEIHLVLDQG